ncbi:MAG: cytochrome P450 [Acidimicrobiales bacterium]
MALIDPSTIDVLSNVPYRDGPPHEALTWLRHNKPLFHQKIDDPIMVGEAWVVTRHRDVMSVSRDLDHFGNFAGHNLRNDHDKSAVTHLLMEDRPKHTEMRLMASRTFTPKVVRRYSDHYHRLAGDLLDNALAAAGDEPFDVVERLAIEFPMQAIVELMGTPLDDHDRLLRWSNATISNLDPDYSPTIEARTEALEEMMVYAQELADERRRHPTDDLATVLTKQMDDGELSEAEYGGYVILLFVAGNETTRNNISWGIKAMAENPDQWDLLRSDPDRYLDSAVEEVTRWASPVNYMSRTVHQPVELHGQTLQPGQKVAMIYLSANRDEEVFTDPFRFDITRDPNPQIAFGYGAHFCMGAHLARLETRAILSELVTRVDRLEVGGPVEHVWSSFINGIKSLPIRMNRI